MEIKREKDRLTIIVEGRIDSSTAPELEAALKSEIGQSRKLVFDFKSLSYISSAGLRVILGARKLMGDLGMKIINVNDDVYDIFEVTGFSTILDIERS